MFGVATLVHDLRSESEDEADRAAVFRSHRIMADTSLRAGQVSKEGTGERGSGFGLLEQPQRAPGMGRRIRITFTKS